MSLSHRQGFAIHHAQHPTEECAVHIFIAVSIHGTGRAIESHGTAILIEHRRLSYRGCNAVKRHHVASRSHPQGQIGVVETCKVLQYQHFLVRQLGLAAMPCIVHDQGSVGLLLLDDLACLRISISYGGGLTLISVPHHLLDLKVRIETSNVGCHLVLVPHVKVVVAIVSHEHQGVLP